LDTFLNHRYRLDAVIGEGTMGTVYCGHDVLLDRDIAVKVLRQEGLGDAERAQLLNEARATARLNHPNVVAVHDAGETAGTEGSGSPFIVMEMVEGHTLHEHHPEDLDTILTYAIQICAGLEDAHSHGIVHGDLKPENVMILADGRAKIMDFGLARFAAQGSIGQDAITGTPFYLAPEQALGQPVDARTDLYALGVLLYELTTGRLPFQGDDVVAIIAQHLAAAVVPPRTLNPAIPPALQTLILQLLSKEPTDRPASAREVQARLAEILGRREGGGRAEAREMTGELPAFLAGEGHPPVDRPAVVTRQHEMERLGIFLDRVLQGEGQIVFVTGEAGTGKTTLVTEFARRAEEAHRHLLVAFGNCNAFTGIGDAYLPFRDVLALLSGDLEAKWAAGLISTEAARRLWVALPRTAQALVRHGQDLVDRLVPGRDLVTRLEAAGVERPALGEMLLNAGAGRPVELDQGIIFEQVRRVLAELAEQNPLLIVLDDLQWADTASIGLLDHLVRRLRSSRILIVAAYRATEVALGREAGPHPLEKVLAELKRYGGDLWIDLEEAQEREGRAFIDDLLDTQPNRLGPAFRKALYALTGGHPLFTIELLRHMEEQGQLVQDRAGTYVTTPRLDWSRLPARVEGVIEERIGRLDEDLQETLSVASVEGETFTAQVVARVRGRDERALMRQISRELADTHRLVTAEGTGYAGRRRLQRYRFRHSLFQWHLYHRLDPLLAEVLHGDVAAALEDLYGPAADQIAPQLAHHYRRAGNADRARYYLRLAGEQARARYAMADAIDYYGQALALTPETDLAARYELLLAREESADREGSRQLQEEDLDALMALAGRMGDVEKQAQVALRRANWASRVGHYAGAVEAAKAGVILARQAGNREQEAKGYRLWGRALVGLGNYDTARDRLEQALDLARAEHLRATMADTLRNLGECAFYSADYARTREYEEEALAINRELGDRYAMGMTFNVLGMVAGHLHDHATEWHYYQRALVIFRQVGDRGGEAAMLSNLGFTLASQGNYRCAGDYYRQALPALRDVKARPAEAVTQNNLGLAALAQEEAGDAEDHFRQALELARAIGERWIEGHALTGLGQARARLGRLDEAREVLEEAIALRSELGQTDLLMESRAALAAVDLASGDVAGAEADVEPVVAYLDDDGEASGLEMPFLLLQTCIRVLQAAHDSRAGRLVARAYALLQEQAARLPDEAARQLFLHSTPWNREIVQMGEGVKA
jgi:adenylate cyclase